MFKATSYEKSRSNAVRIANISEITTSWSRDDVVDSDRLLIFTDSRVEGSSRAASESIERIDPRESYRARTSLYAFRIKVLIKKDEYLYTSIPTPTHQITIILSILTIIPHIFGDSRDPRGRIVSWKRARNEYE